METYRNSLIDPLNNCVSQDSEIYRNFAGQLICSSCNNNLSDLELNCLHHFCFHCIKNRTRILAAKLEDLYDDHSTMPRCPECSTEISKTFARSIVKAAQTKNEWLKTRDFKKCFVCEILRPAEKFYFKCKEICVFCGLHLGEQVCFLCGESKEDYIINYNQDERQCVACGNLKNIKTDYCIEICNQELHCYECLKLALGESRCRGCGKDLDLKVIQFLRKFIFGTCLTCENVVEKKFLVNKKCCDNSICLYCQSLLGTSCKQCNVQLSHEMIDMIQQFK